jgi:homospermidine synthase
MAKIVVTQHKFLFLGYGGVAKCVLDYMKDFFVYDIANIYIVDRCKESIYGPNVQNVSNLFVRHINCINFVDFINEIQMKEGDIVVDLTTNSDTYYFTDCCLRLGIHYINTSIEDSKDRFMGRSIAVQHETIIDNFRVFKERNVVKSNALIEFGQNPGLIQHYVLFALNELNKQVNHAQHDDYSKNMYLDIIDKCQIGTILMSEIDTIDTPDCITNEIVYNTWSVSGLLSEGLNNVEITYGKENHFIKPKFNDINNVLTTALGNDKCNHNVLFLNTIGIESTLDTICPFISEEGRIDFVNFKGSLIHHGEIFDLSRLFGHHSPLMSYAYRMNKHVADFISKQTSSDMTDVQIKIQNDWNSFRVVDNIMSNTAAWSGTDSVGCVMFCGNDKIDKMFWCGSIATSHNTKNKLFTPTIIQVAAGVLSGLSYILEPTNQNKGLLFPSDLNTQYILDKSVSLLGKFMFTEIPVELFTGVW